MGPNLVLGDIDGAEIAVFKLRCDCFPFEEVFAAPVLADS